MRESTIYETSKQFSQFLLLSFYPLCILFIYPKLIVNSIKFDAAGSLMILRVAQSSEIAQPDTGNLIEEK